MHCSTEPVKKPAWCTIHSTYSEFTLSKSPIAPYLGLVCILLPKQEQTI